MTPEQYQGTAMPAPRLYLIDGSAYIFRAFHAIPVESFKRSDGIHTNAVNGFCNMIMKLIEQVRSAPNEDDGHVDYVAVIFDASSKTFRNDLYPEYKANRSEPPEELRPQFALVRDATRAFNLPCIEREGFEADDLIATYAKEATAKGFETVIVSSDKDLMQLVNDSVTMLDPMKDKRIGAGEVVEKFGVAPDKVVDVQSLMGDSTDNVPGVPGIGQKTAAQLIGDYGDLDTLLARAVRDQAGQAAREPDRIRRPGAPVAHPGRAERRRADGPDGRGFPARAAGAGNPARLPARTGVPHADPPGRGRVRRGRADRGAAGRGGRSGAGARKRRSTSRCRTRRGSPSGSRSRASAARSPSIPKPPP